VAVIGNEILYKFASIRNKTYILVQFVRLQICLNPEQNLRGISLSSSFEMPKRRQRENEVETTRQALVEQMRQWTAARQAARAHMRENDIIDQATFELNLHRERHHIMPYLRCAMERHRQAICKRFHSDPRKRLKVAVRAIADAMQNDLTAEVLECVERCADQIAELA